jgi:hypothetical protein
MKKVKIQKHGTMYFLKDGELCGSPLLADGKIDHETVFSIERSPEDFRQGHIAALNKLGARKQDVAWYLNKITYG